MFRARLRYLCAKSVAAAQPHCTLSCVSSGHLHGTITHHVWHGARTTLLSPGYTCPCSLSYASYTNVLSCVLSLRERSLPCSSLSPLHDKRCGSTQKAALFAALTPSLISEPLPLRVAYLRSWVIAAL